MTSSMPRALVACASAWDAPARLPRLLHDAGMRVTVMCPADAAIARTRYAAAVLVGAPSAAAFLEELTAHLAAHRYDWVIAADDPLLDALASRHLRDRASPAARWLPIDVGRVTPDLLASKAAFVELARELGLPIPRSLVCRGAAEIRAAGAAIGFPLVAKRARSYAGMGVRRARDVAELEEAARELGDGSDVVVQAFVEGRLGNTAALFQHGRPVAWLSAFKARTWPGAFGPSCARQLAAPPDVEALLTTLGEALGYHGFGAVDWIASLQTQKLTLLELNARPVPALHLGARDGVDFAVAARAFVRGEPVPPFAARALRDDEPVTPLFPQDFYRAVAEDDTAALRGWQAKVARFDDVPWDDPPLLAHYLRRRLVRRRFDETFLEGAPRSTKGGIDAI